eukprot:6654589-Alexandrium_andersonii.AAC.1
MSSRGTLSVTARFKMARMEVGWPSADDMRPTDDWPTTDLRATRPGAGAKAGTTPWRAADGHVGWCVASLNVAADAAHAQCCIRTRRGTKADRANKQQCVESHREQKGTGSKQKGKGERREYGG